MRALALMLILVQLHGTAQTPQSHYEWRWVIFHPFAALTVKHIHKKCNAVYSQVMIDKPFLNANLDTFSNGGRLDAFRHSFYMAAYAQKIRIKKIRKLGIAHEKTNYSQFKKYEYENGEMPDSLGSVMDLKNNELGLAAGSANKRMNLQDLRSLIIDHIKSGKAVIMKRNSGSGYVDCNNNTLDLSIYKNVWQIPKCLVPSDYIPKD